MPTSAGGRSCGFKGIGVQIKFAARRSIRRRQAEGGESEKPYNQMDEPSCGHGFHFWWAPEKRGTSRAETTQDARSNGNLGRTRLGAGCGDELRTRRPGTADSPRHGPASRHVFRPPFLRRAAHEAPAGARGSRRMRHYRVTSWPLGGEDRQRKASSRHDRGGLRGWRTTTRLPSATSGRGTRSGDHLTGRRRRRPVRLSFSLRNGKSSGPPQEPFE